MPIKGFCASDHFRAGRRSSSARRQRAERSFCCARGKPREIRILCALSMCGFVLIWRAFLLDRQSSPASELSRTAPISRGRSSAVSVGILHEPKIRCIDLGVSVEAAEIIVHGRRVEKCGQAMGECFRQAVLVLVKNVQVIFEAEHRRTRKRVRASRRWQRCGAFLPSRKTGAPQYKSRSGTAIFSCRC